MSHNQPMNPAESEALPNEVVLSVRHLSVGFQTPSGMLRAVDDVSIDVRRGTTLAIVGESGSGKSVLSRAIMRLLPGNAQISPDSEIHFAKQDLLKTPERALQRIRGKRLGMVFQDPMTSLNPVRTIGSQLTEGMRQHLRIGGDEARERALELLRQVGISSPDRRLSQYPHELSGGMRQRIVIAMAIACSPDFLIADEPTTALDVTVQAEILELLRVLRDTRAMTMILITHDMGVASEQADEVAVMYAGQVVERAPSATLFRNPRMPYTQALLRAIPTLSVPPHTRLHAIGGRPPVVIGKPSGCNFAPRCERATPICQETTPTLASEGGRSIRCFNPTGAQR